MKAHIAVLFQLASLSHSYVTSMPFLLSSAATRSSIGRHRNTTPQTATILQPTSSSSSIPTSTTLRGGAKSSQDASSSKCPVTGIATALTSLWGVGGVVYILAKAIRRVLPIALEPFQGGHASLSKLQLGYVVHTYIDCVVVVVV